MLKRIAKAQCGSSMLEVLIAIVVVSLGLLGLAALQTVSLKNNANANLRSQATILAYDIFDRIRANAPNKANYETLMTDTPPASPTTLAGVDRRDWLNALAAALPAGDGSIAITDENGDGTVDDVSITIQWSERVDENENAVQSLTLATQI